MSREKECYRDNIAVIAGWLKEKYGDNRMMLTTMDIVEYTAHDVKTVRKRYMKGERSLSVVNFARMLS